MQNTPVKDLMEDRLIMIEAESTLCAAAKKMKEMNCGCLLVGNANKPDGIITDRDIVVRALSQDTDPAVETVRDHMTDFILSCKATDTLADAAEAMREHGVSRLVVTDEDGHACGLISFGRILRNHDDNEELSAVVARATGNKVVDDRKTLSAAARAH